MQSSRPPAGGEFQFIINVDGGSRGNPGPSGYGVLVRDGSGETIEEIAEYIGVATNNVAEYRGLVAGLEFAVGHGASALKMYCDSELIVRQMQGAYRVKSPDLKPLYERARSLASRLERFVIQHVPRSRNAEADRLANKAMDRKNAPAGPAPSAKDGRRSAFSLEAVVENGHLRPLTREPKLVEGRRYEARLRPIETPTEDA